MTARKVVMAYPYVPEAAIEAVAAVLRSRFVGQGPKVDEFEREFADKFDRPRQAVAVNSGTAALELAYDLMGLGPGDRVITTPLTCTATNIPLVRRGCELVFADIRRDTLTIDWDDVARLHAMRPAKAIVSVNLHGIDACIPEWARPITVCDSAQALGLFGGRFTACSFQAIKHITTGDGGMLYCANEADAREARLRRWFGIDRERKLANGWQPYRNRKILFDIEYPGYKFQMNDIAAAMGLAGLDEYWPLLGRRRVMFEVYKAAHLPLVDSSRNKLGYCCVLVENRDEFCAYLNGHGIETNVMQVRNDVYRIFEPFRVPLPNMDWVDERYVCIPLHNRMTLDDAEYVAAKAREALPCEVPR